MGINILWQKGYFYKQCQKQLQYILQDDFSTINAQTLNSKVKFICYISNQYACKRYVGEFLSYLCYTQDIIDFWLKTITNYQSFNKIEF